MTGRVGGWRDGGIGWPQLQHVPYRGTQYSLAHQEQELSSDGDTAESDTSLASALSR